MAGNARFESSSASPEDSGFSGSYSNGQKGGYSGASLDRSGSFRENGETRNFSSGASTPRGVAGLAGDLPPLNEYLNLDPVTIENQKYTRLGELRRALGIISFGSISEDNSFGAAHTKPAPAVATEELRRFKATVLDASNKAKSRKRMFDESSYKLNKYYEALSLKKQQRNGMITNERSGGLNLLKMGTQVSRNSSELVNQKGEERAKNVVVSKRVRSSVAESRADGQTNSLARRMINPGKDRAALQDCGEGSDTVEEKIRRLPVAGETWDIKMKRKRSVGPLLGRPSDDGEPKRAMHYKLNNDLGSTSCDAQTSRSGSSIGGSKVDGVSVPGSLNIRAISKNELDKVSFSRDSASGLSKERPRGNNKFNVLEDNQIPTPNSSIKGKASRAPRSGPLTSGNLSPNFSRTSASGSVEAWEQLGSGSKIHSVNGVVNRNRPMTPGSSSPPMAQWVGQRPHKISRTRRANLVSPVSNHDESQLSPENCSPSDLETPAFAPNGIFAKGVPNGAQQFKQIKLEMVSSPARLSEGEESGACENRESRLKEKGVASAEIEGRGTNAFQNSVPMTLNSKKSKINVKEEPGDGVRRQGRSGRGSSFPKVSTSPVKEKLEGSSSTKPVKSTRVGSERSGSKSGRPPLKKMSERKGVARIGHINAIGSPDFSGEQNDDREELLEAAKYACNFSSHACPGPFWKKMQPIFAPVSLEDISYLKKQIKLMELNYKSSPQMLGIHNAIMDNFAKVDKFVSSAHVSGERRESLQDRGQDLSTIIGGRLGSEERNKGIPLYHRVLSALIMEGEAEEFEEENGLGFISFQDSREYASDADIEQRNMSNGSQNLQQYAVNGYSYDDRNNNTRETLSPCFSSPEDLLKCNRGFPHLDNGFSENGSDGSLSISANVNEAHSFNCPYDQLCIEDKLLMELQSVGLYPEIVPNLTDGEDEPFASDIFELQKGLSEQVGKTREHLKTIVEASEEGREIEKRHLEHVAMDRLIEVSYKKLLATRGSYASKHGLAKVPKPVAVAFMKRTLARCRRFEETGKSCFSEPALRDVMYATPHKNDLESTAGVNPAMNMPHEMNPQQAPRLSGSLSNWPDRDNHHAGRAGTNLLNGFGDFSHSSEQDFAKTGPITNRGKKKELLLDDLGGGSFSKPASGFSNTLSGGAKGKRSERDRDKDASARSSKAGRLPNNNKGDRKAKPKPKHKTGQLSTSGNVSVNNGIGFRENGARREAELVPEKNNNLGNPSADEGKAAADLTALTTDLGVANDIIDENQDFSSWWEEDGGDLQEDFSMGLEIPMDDLFEVVG